MRETNKITFAKKKAKNAASGNSGRRTTRDRSRARRAIGLNPVLHKFVFNAFLKFYWHSRTLGE